MLFPRNTWFAISTEHVICHFHETRDSPFPRNSWSTISVEHVVYHFRGTRDLPFLLNTWSSISVEHVVYHFRETCDLPFPRQQWFAFSAEHVIRHFRGQMRFIISLPLLPIGHIYMVQALVFLRSEQNSFHIVSVNFFIEERAWRYVPPF
jgi:hypothetical protein